MHLSNKNGSIMPSYMGIHGITPSLYFLLILTTSLYDVVQAQPSPDARDPYNYARVTPSMAIIIVVLIAALFFMGFFSIYIRHCTDARVGGSVRAITNIGRSRRGNVARGLDQEVLQSFPTLVYSEVKNLKFGKATLECAVCLNEFEDDETLRLIPKCDHVFHPDCIDVWLGSHTTCPVCRANLTPQPGDPVPLLAGSNPEPDLEAQDHHNESDGECIEDNDNNNRSNNNVGDENQAPKVEKMSMSRSLKRNWTPGSASGRARTKFPRSHSTGHSLVQPGENTDRFTLRLPEEVRTRIMSRALDRTMSMVVLPRERSSRRGYRTGGEGGIRGKYERLERLDEPVKSDPWVSLSRTPSFLARASSFLKRSSSSVRSPRVAAKEGEGTSSQPVGPNVVATTRPPV